jgi:hypothetical protein
VGLLFVAGFGGGYKGFIQAKEGHKKVMLPDVANLTEKASVATTMSSANNDNGTNNAKKKKKRTTTTTKSIQKDPITVAPIDT